MYTMFRNPATAGRLGNEMLWMAWNGRDQQQDPKHKGRDAFFGFASQNPVTLYKHYVPVAVSGIQGAYDLYFSGYYALSVRDDSM